MDMITIDEAFAKIDDIAEGFRLPSETVSVRESVGRVLSSDVYSKLDLPPFNRSAMDGYAVLEGDEREKYRLLETIRAGEVGKAKLVPGTTVKIMTGAPVPAGAGKVVMWEHTSESDGFISIAKHTKAANICKKGEDVKKGELIFSKGRRINEVDISNLVACGIEELEVVRQIKVAIVSTGDEIVDSFKDLSPGKIMNSNGPLLSALCRKYNLKVVCEVSVKDDKEEMESVLKKALKVSDIVVLSGGVSEGDYDYVPEIMNRLGLKIYFDRVLTKPGKPMTFASKKGKVILGLPGNPVAVYLTFHLFVLRVAVLMSGVKQSEIRKFKVQLKKDFKRRKSERQEYVPCRINKEGEAEALEFHGSAHLAALSEADGFFIVERGVLSVSKGELVSFIPTKLQMTENRRQITESKG
jgi:molybdopterin molybdotransferase